MLAAGLVDEVRMDVVPVVFGSGKRYSGRSTHSTCWRNLTWYSGQPGASPALSGAPLTELDRDARSERDRVVPTPPARPFFDAALVGARWGRVPPDGPEPQYQRSVLDWYLEVG